MAIQSLCLSFAGGGKIRRTTYATAVAELKVAEAALQTVHDKGLQRKKGLCLEKITDGEKDLKRFFDVH